MRKQDYYNDFFDFGQQKINFSFFELSLPDDDPVYTLKNVMEELDFSGLLACYSDKGRTGFNPIMPVSYTHLSARIHERRQASPEEMFSDGRIHLSTGPIHTVKPLEADIPKGKLTVITGVSGS